MIEWFWLCGISIYYKYFNISDINTLDYAIGSECVYIMNKL